MDLAMDPVPGEESAVDDFSMELLEMTRLMSASMDNKEINILVQEDN